MTQVPLWRWRKANSCLQQALRVGDIPDAKKWAHTLLHYLGEMGLIDDTDRQGITPNRGHINNGMVKQTKAKIANTT